MPNAARFQRIRRRREDETLSASFWSRRQAAKGRKGRRPFRRDVIVYVKHVTSDRLHAQDAGLLALYLISRREVSRAREESRLFFGCVSAEADSGFGKQQVALAAFSFNRFCAFLPGYPSWGLFPPALVFSRRQASSIRCNAVCWLLAPWRSVRWNALDVHFLARVLRLSFASRRVCMCQLLSMKRPSRGHCGLSARNDAR